jgi:hypothetical protein
LRRGRAPVLLLLALAACGREPPAATPGARGAPPAPAATVVLEPPRLRVGDVAQVEIDVVTPPDHAVPPIRPPEPAALGPLWLLEARTLPVEKHGARWIHRTRLRVRARETGSGTWPVMHIEVVGPEGERSTVDTDARPFEVVSILPTVPDRVEPYSYRVPALRGGRGAALAAAAGGAAAALLFVAGVAALRRARRRAGARRIAAERATAGGAAPWSETLLALEAARAASDTDWRRSADGVSRALRRYVERRFGLPVRTRSTEEAAALVPPLSLARRWPAALAWLTELDALRFRPVPPPDSADRVRAIAAASKRWVVETIPPDPEGPR